MWKLFYRNTRLLILTLVLLVVWGISAYQALPRMEDPEIKQPRAMVTTFFPGASAYRVESLVTERIEQALQELDEIETLESTSRPNTSIILIERKEDVGDVDEAWARVREKLTEVAPQLPAGTTNPEYTAWEGKAYALIAALTWTLDSPPNYAILGRLAEEMEDVIRAQPETEEVEFFGAPQEEIIVAIDPADLAALGLTPQELARQIQSSDAKVAAGQLHSANNDLVVEVESELASLDRIRQIPIRLGESGQFARVGEIATVTKGIREPAASQAVVKGRPAVALGAHVQSESRIDTWAQSVRQGLQTFEQQLPRGVSLEIVLDQSRYVTNRLNGLIVNLLLGVLCVVVSTIPLLGWRSALIVGSALPLSILMVFGGMSLFNIPLHQMSVTGLVIALGLLIDNAIVVVDEVQAHIAAGVPAHQAIAQSINQLVVPLLASTLTTVLTFMPIAFAPGRLGDFVGAVGVSVILALVSSLLLCLTVIPALVGRTHRWQASTSGNGNGRPPRLSGWRSLAAHPWLHHGISHPALTNFYRRGLTKTLRRPALAISLSLILPLLGFAFAITLDEQFFPPAERDQINVELELQSQAALALTRSQTAEATALMRQHPEVVDVNWFIGENAPTFYYNLQRGRQNARNYAQALVDLKSSSGHQGLIQQLQAELDRMFPAARVLVRQLEQGPPFAAPIELRLYGPDLQVLRELGEQARGELAKVTNVTHTRASLIDAVPQLGVRLDEEQVRLAGLSNAAIAQYLNDSLEGAVGGSILEETEELPVRVRLSQRDRGDLDAIASLDLPVATPGGGTLPLSAVGEIELVPELAAIPRRNGERVNTIQGFLQAGTLPAVALQEFQQRLEASGFQLPPGYSSEIGGESEQRSQAQSSLQSTLGVLLVMMVAVLVVSFNSFRLASIIGLVGLLSMGLGLFALWFFGYPLGFMAILGTVGLVGVAINDSIVVLAALRADPGARQGDFKAACEVVVRSTRHVLATTITTIVGFLPLLADGGEFWPPLAICVAGGVGGATLVALVFVPSVYLLMMRWGGQKPTSSQPYRDLSPQVSPHL